MPVLSAGESALYDIQLATFQSDPKGPQLLVGLDGDLEQHKEDSEWVTSWKDMRNIVLNSEDAAQIKAQFIGKSFLTGIDDEGVHHSIGSDFPKAFLGLQINFLNKFYLPFNIVQEGQIVRREQDELAIYDVTYDISKTEDGFQVVRQFEALPSSLITMDEKLKSIVYEFDKQGRLRIARGTLAFRNAENPKEIIRTEIAFRLKKASPVSGKESLADRKLQYQRYDSRTAVAAANDGNASEELDLEEAYRRVDAFNNKTAAQDRFYLYGDLSNDLEKHPEHLDRLVEKILSITDRDESAQRRASTLFSVLAGNSSEQSAKALAKMASTDCPDDFCKLQAVMAHGMHRFPTPETAATILKIAESAPNEEVAGNAYLSVGISGNRLGDRFPSLAQDMITNVTNAKNEDIKTQIIAGMGNHAQGDYLPVLQEGLKAENSNVKMASIFAMRALPNDQVIPSLMNIVETEESDIVRERALKSLAYRDISKENYLKVADIGLKGDATDELTASKFLVEAYKNFPESATDSVQVMLSKAKSPDAIDYLKSQIEVINADKGAEAAILNPQ